MQRNSEMRYPLSFLKIIPFLVYFIFSRLIVSLLYFIRFLPHFDLSQIIQKRENVEMLYLIYMKTLLNCCSDIEINPGPKQSSLNFCHRTLNGISAHDFIKVSVLQEYITHRNFDIICLLKLSLTLSAPRAAGSDTNGCRGRSQAVLKKLRCFEENLMNFLKMLVLTLNSPQLLRYNRLKLRFLFFPEMPIPGLNGLILSSIKMMIG